MQITKSRTDLIAKLSKKLNVNPARLKLAIDYSKYSTEAISFSVLVVLVFLRNRVA